MPNPRTMFVRMLRSACPIVAAVAMVCLPAAARSQTTDKEPKSKQAEKSKGKSVDDALLDDLDNELLDGLGEIKKQSPKKPAVPGTPDEQPLDQPDGEDVGMPSADEDPLAHISQEMRRAERLIPQREKQPQAEQVHRQIAENLAKLIADAEQRRAQQQASKSSQQQPNARRQSVQQPKTASGDPNKDSNNPAADSTNRLGNAEPAKPDPKLFQGLLKDTWGNLPQREREQMLQSSRERFLPQYELLIERYYRRLAEEHTK